MPGEWFEDSDGYKWFVEGDGTLTLFRHEDMNCYSHIPRKVVEKEYGSLRRLPDRAKV